MYTFIRLNCEAKLGDEKKDKRERRADQKVVYCDENTLEKAELTWRDNYYDYDDDYYYFIILINYDYNRVRPIIIRENGARIDGDKNTFVKVLVCRRLAKVIM